MEEKETKETIVRKHLPLVCSVARRFVRSGYELEDLIQIGMIGLLKAWKNFDVHYGVKFSTYAVPMIMGEIRRTFRDQGQMKVSRTLKSLAAQILKLKEKFLQEQGREPLIGEIAQSLAVSREEIVAAMEAVQPMVSLDQPLVVGEDGFAVLDTLPSVDGVNQWLDHLAFRQAFAALAEREQKIFIFRFWQNKTQTEVAKILGVSQVQISRLEKRIIAKIKRELKPEE